MFSVDSHRISLRFFLADCYSPSSDEYVDVVSGWWIAVASQRWRSVSAAKNGRDWPWHLLIIPFAFMTLVRKLLLLFVVC